MIEPKPLGDAAPSPEFLRLIPHEFARRHLILSAGTAKSVVGGEQDEPTETLHIAPSTKPAPIHNVGVRLGRRVVTHIVEPEALASAIDRAYARGSVPEDGGGRSAGGGGAPPSEHDLPPLEIDDLVTGGVEEGLRSLLAQADSDLLHTGGKAPLVRLVDLLLFEAVQRRASDIHVQPLADRTLVRYRLDGVLHTVR